MKKLIYLTAAALAAFAFTACEKTGGNENEETDPNFTENEGSFTYYGETYKTVTLENGSVWMAEPLRYVPEGYTVSADPADDNAHIWYPYELINETGEPSKINADEARALTDSESIEAKGYLYDLHAVFGTEITADNCGSFEGAQGICPKGWHIPTRADFLSLCGLSNKAEGEEGNTVDENALFYDSSYGGGNVTLFNQAGWNYVFSGCRMKSNFNATGTYQLTQQWSGNSSLTESYGEPGITYIASSTAYKVVTDKEDETKVTNIQFFGMMTTFIKKNSPEGKVNVAHVSTMTGQQVRCVKDAE